MIVGMLFNTEVHLNIIKKTTYGNDCPEVNMRLAVDKPSI
jgi:hypothetical protein